MFPKNIKLILATALLGLWYISDYRILHWKWNFYVPIINNINNIVFQK